MYLSKVEIIGFKSFLHRVNLSFDEGVTAIVGPNGCGKTNIVDAIRWALGEQRYSTLRSDKMEDVIFNGTKNRKPLGLAEVSLTIENTKGILPTDYSEVTITRRVFRSGESEYMLNKVPCRLKDIVDLFMDTGMGSDAYSVIELKMVETILSDKTDERRRLFEEAAGVTKYKYRRKAALRKLEDVQLDLARVNDIVKEVQKTVNSLERQAKKTEQYNEFSSRLKALEIDLLEREYACLNAKLLPLEEEFKHKSSEKNKANKMLQHLEEETAKLQNNLIETEKAISDIHESESKKLDEIRRVQEKILVAQERSNSLLSNIKQYELEKNDLKSQQKILTQEKLNLIAKHEQVLSEFKKLESEFLQEKNEHIDISKRLEAKQIEVSTLNDVLLKLAHNIIEKQGKQEQTKVRIDNLKSRNERVVQDNILYRNDIERAIEIVKHLTIQDRELRKNFAEAELKLLSKQKEKEELKQKIENLQKQSIELTNLIERKTSQKEFLLKMLETHEGFSDGTKFLLNHNEWKKKFITIADVIHTDEKYRIAIEAALSGMENALIVEKQQDGYKAIEELKKQNKGKTTIINLEWIPTIIHRRDKESNRHFTFASNVVQCDAKYRKLINFLLDDVIIIEKVGEESKIFSLYTDCRCVTLNGEIITSSGLLLGGSKLNDDNGIITKRSQILQIEQEISNLEEKVKKLSEEQKAIQQIYNSIVLEEDKANVKAIEKEMTTIEVQIAQYEFEKKRAYESIEKNEREITAIEEEITKSKKDYENQIEELKLLETQKAEKENQLIKATNELEILEVLWNDKTKIVNELERKVTTIQNEAHNLRRDIERSEVRINDIEITLGRRQDEINRAINETTHLANEIKSLEKNLDTLLQEYKIIEESKKEIEQKYSKQRDKLHKIELAIKDERRSYDIFISSVHELEMKISEIKSNIEHLKLRAQEEFEIELQLKHYPEEEWVDFTPIREEVKNLKERIKVLGAINFAAFDEFNSESERLNFLTQQRNDLIEAEKTLMNTIEEINNTAQRRFLDTFSKIRTNFITTFKELFEEGDECDLKLEEGVDPLEAGIEIIAKPRGKRPTSIDLLSGGEKTLTAIALLFAIYLVKPSPFCILDEVDAPLDDSNIDRFTRILKKFSNNTQFIVVTHNKRTMEAAQALYGVTMEEEGVSKIVTVRFNQEAHVRSATVTN